MDVNTYLLSKITQTNNNTTTSSLFKGVVVNQDDKGVYTILVNDSKIYASLSDKLEIGKMYTFQQNNVVKPPTIKVIHADLEAILPNNNVVEKRNENIKLRIERLLTFIQGKEFAEIKNTIATHLISKNNSFPTTQLTSIISTPFLTGFSRSIHELMNYVSPSSEGNKIGNQVRQLISPITITPETILNPNRLLSFILPTISKQFGLNYESAIKTGNFTKEVIGGSLKPFIIQLLKNTTDPKVKKASQNILMSLNSFQLLTREEGVFQQQLIPLLYLHDNAYRDWYIHLTRYKEDIQRREDGNTRILFLLDLPSLSNTMVDIHVKQKLINITIVNEDAQALEGLVGTLKTSLIIL